MRPLLVLRPEPGNAETIARAEALGVSALSFPLFAAASIAWKAPSSDDFDAILLTSANAIRMAGHGLNSLRKLPAYCVGEATAIAAQAAGLSVALIGQSGVDQLLAQSGNKHVLHLCGEDRIAPKPTGATITPLACYRMDELPARSELLETLKQNPVALLHSPRAARHFASLVDISSSSRSTISLCALSPAIADAAGVGWEDVAISPNPRDDEILHVAISHFKFTTKASE